MNAKIKPVQPTVIKDKRILREVIAQIRREPTPEDIAYVAERRGLFARMRAK